MPITLNEWLTSLPRQQRLQEQQAAKFRERATASQRADEAQTVVNHPGWQKFVDALTVQLVNADRAVEEAKQRLVERPMTSQEAELLRLEARRWLGRAEAFREALAIIPSLLAENATVSPIEVPQNVTLDNPGQSTDNAGNMT